MLAAILWKAGLYANGMQSLNLCRHDYWTLSCKIVVAAPNKGKDFD